MRYTLEKESIALLQLQGRVHVRGAVELAVDRARDVVTMRDDGVQGVINKRLADASLIKSIRYNLRAPITRDCSTAMCLKEQMLSDPHMPT